MFTSKAKCSIIWCQKGKDGVMLINSLLSLMKMRVGRGRTIIEPSDQKV